VTNKRTNTRRQRGRGPTLWVLGYRGKMRGKSNDVKEYKGVGESRSGRTGEKGLGEKEKKSN